MTIRHAADVSFFLVDGLNIAPSLTDFDARSEARTEESHGLGDAWTENSFVGVKEAEVAVKGFYDDSEMGVINALTSGPGSTNILAYCLEGTATGGKFVAWAGGVETDFARLAERDGLTKVKGTFRSAGVVEQGKVLQTYGAVGSSGRKAWVDGGASSTGGVGYLAYNASAGEANVTIVHSASAGATAGAVLVTFARISSGHGAQRVETTALIQRYTAAAFTTATATGAIGALNAFVGFVRTTSHPAS